jgi:outer membrane protein TolC
VKSRFIVLLSLGLSFLGLSSAQDLSDFLTALQKHPAVLASKALVNASQSQLDAVYFPVSGELTAGYNRLSVDTEGLTLPANFDENEFKNGVQFSATATFRPFVFGDIADLAGQRELDLKRNQLSFRQTLANLEAQALEAALQVQVAENALLLAQQAQSLSSSVLEITQTRLAKGAATKTDLLNSEQNLFEAQNQVKSAELQLALAQQGLNNLVGSVRLTDMPQLEPVTGTLPAVIQAQLDLALAQIGRGNSERGLYPVGQLSYTLPIRGEETVTDAMGNSTQQQTVNSELAFSIESRTLQPSLKYSYQNPKQTVAGFAAQPQLGLDLADLQGSLTIGVSLSISPEAIAALQAADARLAAAQAGLVAAQDNATLSELSLQNALETSRLGLQLSEQALANASLNLDNTKERSQLGLATELDVQQAALALTQSKLSQLTAKLSYLQAVLNTYRSYAIPVSEAVQ